MKNCCRSIVFAALTLPLLSMGPAKVYGQDGGTNDAPQFSAIYAFGDSLTDTGNMSTITQGQIPPSPPYAPGRVSNGAVWIEYLATKLNTALYNFAFVGAETGRNNYWDQFTNAEFPGLHDEIDFFVELLDGNRADPNALYVVWIGANDFFNEGFDPAKSISRAINNTTRAVRRLHAQGARHIMVVNLSDLGLTPFGYTVEPPGSLSFLSALYNGALDASLNQLANVGVDTIRVDASTQLQQIVADPAGFGFTNVTNGYIFTLLGDPEGYLFWDLVHPTTKGHAIFAEAAYQAILAAAN